MTKKNFILTFLIFALIIIIDQFTKLYIEETLRVNEEIPVIKNFFYITLVYNTGAAWGIGSNSTLLLTIISSVATVVALVFATKNDFKSKKMYSFALCLIIAGAFGNLYDRFYAVLDIRKGVVDFLEFHFGSYIFPVFNVADMSLVIGVIMLAVDILFLEDRRKNAKEISNK